VTVAGGIADDPAPLAREAPRQHMPVSKERSTQESPRTRDDATPRRGAAGHPGPLLRLRESAAAFWIRLLAHFAARAPWFVDLVKPIFVHGTWLASISIRRGTTANARRILGESSSRPERVRLGKAVLANFYEFFAEVGRNSRRTQKEMLVEVESIIGHEKLLAARAAGRGAVIAVAHMGSYEVAAAALKEYEPHINVVFKREPIGAYERLRQELHLRLGVNETPVDEGMGIWFHLRNRLQANDVVLIQADRVMPGQRGVRLPFLGGTLEVPTGPVKLAMAAGSPIIPVFALRVGRRKVRIIIEDPIIAEGGLREAGPGAPPHPALVELTNLIARYVEKHPDQWLLLSPAFVEDQAAARTGQTQERA